MTQVRQEQILLTGATGFVGLALVKELIAHGYVCTVVTRSPERARRLLPAGATACHTDDPWPPVAAVINLAGESIVGRWTAQKKRRIVESRLQTTSKVVAWLERISPRPAVLLSMSAVGIYGDRPDERLTENSEPDPADKFRAQVTLAWEHEAMAALAYGVRVVLLRLGNVLHPDGGYLANLLKVYHPLPILGLAPPNAMFSWVSRRDTVRLIRFALEQEAIGGPLNITSPHPVSSGELTELLADRLGKRVWGQVPAWSFRLALGEFSDALLDSQIVLPEVALAHGFRFVHPDLALFLSSVL